MNLKNNIVITKILIIITITFFVFFITNQKTTIIYAMSLNDNDNIREIIKNKRKNFITTYDENGTMNDVEVNKCKRNNSLEEKSGSFNELQIIDSGKNDNDSIVITIMGDGFTSTEQNLFINSAYDVADYLINQYPMRLYKDYFNIYAVEVISNESGVSRDVDAFNWWTNNPSVDNYFGSSFWFDGNAFNQGTERLLYIENESRVYDLEHDGSVLTIIICNSTRSGGGGGEFAVVSLNTNSEEIACHEFGHAFASLSDEYYFSGYEAPNLTQNSNPTTVKWNKWIDPYGEGIYNIGLYPSSNSGDGLYWYAPHPSCKMRALNNDFCAVCSEEIINYLESYTGHGIDITNISSTTTSITDFDLDYSGELCIPMKINGKYVSIIGDEALKNCTGITSIIIPNHVTSIGISAFEGCTSLEEIIISDNVTSIGSCAFIGCTNLEEIIIEKESIPLTSLGTNAFYGCSSLSNIIVPLNRVADYANDNGWSNYQAYIEPDDTTTTYNIYSNNTRQLMNYIFSGYNKIYRLYISTQDTYEISATANSNIMIKLYDDDYSLIDSSPSTIVETLNYGNTYYLSVEFSNNSSSGIITTYISKYVPHVHSYVYTWNSYTHHLKSCSCGDSSLEVHAVASGSFPPGQQYAPCLICNGMASIGLVGPDSINQYPSTVNGSYILPNGVVVLVAADINDYLNGTLIFNYPNVNSINNNLPYLKKEEDYFS